MAFRHFKQLIGCLFLLLWMPCAHAQAPPVETCNSGGSFSSNVAQCGFSSNTTVNQLLVVAAVITDTTTTFSSGSDSCGDTWTQVSGSPWRGTGVSIIAMQTVTNSSGCRTISMNLSVSTSGSVVGAEYAGMVTNNATVLDCVSTAGTGNSTALLSGNCSTRSIGSATASMTRSVSGQWVAVMLAYKQLSGTLDVLVGIGGTVANSGTFTAGSGYTLETSIVTTFNGGSSLEDQNVGTPSPTISPITPSVKQGATQTFSCSANCGGGGTWTCTATNASGGATTCAGSIVSGTGVYTAPSTVTPQQMLAGYQLMPNNHIFNTNISAFPVASNSATIIGDMGAADINYLQLGMPINYTSNLTPTQGQVFYYTAPNNGVFQIPTYPGTWPTEARIEGGWISAITNQNSDHHLLTIDTTNGNMQDMYQHYTAGLSTQGCTLCTSQSGLKYTANDYALPVNGATDAAGMEISPLLLRLQEVEQAIATSGTINHALRFTLPQFSIGCPQLWPATQCANNGGAIPFGTRIRLKSSFNISGYSAIAQILLTQLKNYGVIVSDGGTAGTVTIEWTKWPTAIMNAFAEISFSPGIVALSNFEVVDESGFELSSTSGECGCNQETVTFTRTSDSITSSTDIDLVGVAVNFPYDLVQIQVGAPAYQLTALTNLGGVTWSMSPSVGTLSSTGLYTPPGSVASPTTITVTATNTVDTAIAGQVTLVVFPAGPIRIVPGSLPGVYTGTMNPTNYTDSGSNIWYSIGDDGGYSYNQGITVTGTSDPTLYKYEYFGYGTGGNDMRFDFIVPNGAYTVTYKATASSPGFPTSQVQTLELNGASAYSNLNLLTAAGGANIAFDDPFNIIVNNNELSFVQRIVNNQGTYIGALQITYLGTATIPAVMLQ